MDKEIAVPRHVTKDGLSGRYKASGRAHASPAEAVVTPYAHLRQLANTARKLSTPRRRSPGTGASLPQKYTNHTASEQSHTPKSKQPLQQVSANPSNPVTPHALRALQQRRATPGRDRRKSGRAQRETPREGLRVLSKVLAPFSQPSKSSPHPLSASKLNQEIEEFEDEPDLPQPRLSLAIDDEGTENDSFEDVPPRLSMPPEDGEQTGVSIEMYRRAVDHRPTRSLSIGTFESLRESDQFSKVSELDPRHELQPRYDDPLQQPSLGILENAHGVKVANLSRHRDDAGDQGHEVFEDHLRLRDSRGTEQVQQHDSDAHSPFVLHLPLLNFGNSSPLNVSLDKPPEGTQDALKSQVASQVTSPILGKPVKITRRRNPKTPKRSRFGVNFSSLPPGVTKEIATNHMRTLGGKQSKVNRNMLDAMMEAGERFFEQLGGDLGAFADHAKRKRIDESDVITVMKRQRQLTSAATPFSLAQKLLPAELLREMRMPKPRPGRLQDKPFLNAVDGDDGEPQPL